jgi:hypothetical protein
MKTKHTATALILQIFDESYDRKAWHGPNLRGAIRRVDAKLAVWRPGPKRHNIAEIVVHCAYWKYALRRTLRGDKRGSFRLKGSNWFALPEKLSAEQWREYIRWLDEEHALLREAVESAPLEKPIAAGKEDLVAKRVYSMALHDVYHAGQSQTLKAQQK